MAKKRIRSKSKAKEEPSSPKRRTRKVVTEADRDTLEKNFLNLFDAASILNAREKSLWEFCGDINVALRANNQVNDIGRCGVFHKGNRFRLNLPQSSIISFTMQLDRFKVIPKEHLKILYFEPITEQTGAKLDYLYSLIEKENSVAVVDFNGDRILAFIPSRPEILKYYGLTEECDAKKHLAAIVHLTEEEIPLDAASDVYYSNDPDKKNHPKAALLSLIGRLDLSHQQMRDILKVIGQPLNALPINLNGVAPTPPPSSVGSVGPSPTPPPPSIQNVAPPPPRHTNNGIPTSNVAPPPPSSQRSSMGAPSMPHFSTRQLSSSPPPRHYRSAPSSHAPPPPLSHRALPHPSEMRGPLPPRASPPPPYGGPPSNSSQWNKGPPPPSSHDWSPRQLSPSYMLPPPPSHPSKHPDDISRKRKREPHRSLDDGSHTKRRHYTLEHLENPRGSGLPPPPPPPNGMDDRHNHPGRTHREMSMNGSSRHNSGGGNQTMRGAISPPPPPMTINAQKKSNKKDKKDAKKDMREHQDSYSPTTHLWVGFSSGNVDFGSVKKDFSTEFKSFLSIDFLKHQKCAFVHYATIEDAIAAKRRWDGTAKYPRISYKDNQGKRGNK